MSNSQLPERASLEYLKKLAKDRLRDLRRSDPATQLATALLALAREHGFSSWRELRAEVIRRQTRNLEAFFESCSIGDAATLRARLSQDPALARATKPPADAGPTDYRASSGTYGGWTGLHSAARGGNLEAVRALLDHGADPNAREDGDNTYPLHWAAAQGNIDVVRTLLDSGGDVHGSGDVHELDVIGWATFLPSAVEDPEKMRTRHSLISLLLARGARHHIFSAMSLGDRDLIRKVVEENPETLDRRLSGYDQGQTPLHYAMNRKRYDVLALLLDLGADLEAVDKNGQTALALALLRGDQEAARQLRAAGATPPKAVDASRFTESMAQMGGSVQKGVPMIYVPDVARALAWYQSIGFTELARYADDNQVNFGMVAFGKAELMLNLRAEPAKHDVSLWFYTDQIDSLYQLLKSRQLAAAQAAPSAAGPATDGIEFEQDIEDMFYGARQFGIRDGNGYSLYFIQPQNN